MVLASSSALESPRRQVPLRPKRAARRAPACLPLILNRYLTISARFGAGVKYLCGRASVDALPSPRLHFPVVAMALLLQMLADASPLASAAARSDASAFLVHETPRGCGVVEPSSQRDCPGRHARDASAAPSNFIGRLAGRFALAKNQFV